MSRVDEWTELAGRRGQELIAAARRSVTHAVRTGRPLRSDTSGVARELLTPAATFVSLHRGDELLGCVGTLAPVRPLIDDLIDNAAAAVLRDPRCPPLLPSDVEHIRIDISLLTPSEPMAVESEADLIAQLRPGVDGVTLEERGRRGTFLPVVWKSLPDPATFVRELKRKAGLPVNEWSPAIRVSRYRTVTIAEESGPDLQD